MKSNIKKNKTLKKSNKNNKQTKKQTFKELELHRNTALQQNKLVSCKELQYKHLKNIIIPKSKKFYKNINSNKQIQSVVKYGLTENAEYLTKLCALISKHYHPKNYDLIYKLITSNKSDTAIFTELRKLRKWYPKSYFLLCNKHKITSQLTDKFLKTEKYTVKNYLDVGCGNCKFTKTLGKTLGLKEDEIYGIDPDNYAEKDDWKRDTSGMIFKRVLPEEVYPFDDNKFDLITMNMVLHHVVNLQHVLNEVSRVLKKGGYLIITDHDAFTYIDKMLIDIEHQLYTEVLYYEPKNKGMKYSDKQGHMEYFNWLEFDNMIIKNGYNWKEGRLINLSIRSSDINPTRTFFSIYKKN